jgi:hypothetical protein
LKHNETLKRKARGLILFKTKHKTKEQQLFELFDQGKSTTSDEVKALVAKSDTRNSYISKWRKVRGIKLDESSGIAQYSKRNSSKHDAIVRTIKTNIGESKRARRVNQSDR